MRVTVREVVAKIEEQSGKPARVAISEGVERWGSLQAVANHYGVRYMSLYHALKHLGIKVQTRTHVKIAS